MKVFDPYSSENEFLVGYKGSKFLVGYKGSKFSVGPSPYIPLYVTPPYKRPLLNRIGIELGPIHSDAFDYQTSRDQFQVRIHVWGFLGRVLYRLLHKKWNASKDGEWSHSDPVPRDHCYCSRCSAALKEGQDMAIEKAEITIL